MSTDDTAIDPKDAVFYEVVMEAREDSEAYLVTGNLKHFAVTPKEMMDILEYEGLFL